MKKVLLVLSMLLVVSGAFAEDVCAPAGDCGYLLGDVKTTIDASFYTKYMLYGIDVYDDRPAFQPSVKFDFGTTGLSAMLWYSTPTTSANGTDSVTEFAEFNYAINYANKFNACEATQVDYVLGYRFHDFYNWNNNPTTIKRKSKNINFYEVSMDFAMPNLIAGGIVPHYQASYFAPYSGEGLNREVAGWLHTFGLKYDTTICCPIRNVEQPIELTWDIVYNDGADILPGLEADHDWQHMTFGLAAPMQVGCGTLTPSVYYQKNLDSYISDANEDTEEVYAGVSYALSF